MSRFDLNSAHIDGLVNAGLQFGVIAPFDDVAPVGRMLLRQHHRSVGVHQDDDDPPDYVVTLTDRPFHPVAVLCLLDCYEYQSSGTADWHTSASHTWTSRLRDEVLSRLPAEAKAQVRHGANYIPAYRLLPAYTDTPWGITALEQIPDIGDGVSHSRSQESDQATL
jgi:hypothetical protein